MNVQKNSTVFPWGRTGIFFMFFGGISRKDVSEKWKNCNLVGNVTDLHHCHGKHFLSFNVASLAKGYCYLGVLFKGEQP